MPSFSQQTNSSTTAILASLAVTAGLVAWWNRHPRRHGIPGPLLKSPYAPQLRLAVRMALQAGSNMVEHCDTAGTVLAKKMELEFKGQPEDFCTAVDLHNETIITQAIQTSFPTDCIIGEETTGTGEIPPLTAQATWIIDPIDGTTNFSFGTASNVRQHWLLRRQDSRHGRGVCSHDG